MHGENFTGKLQNRQTIKNICRKEGRSYTGPQCSIGLQCYNGQIEVRHCKGGLVWNPKVSMCDQSSNVEKCSQTKDKTSNTGRSYFL